MPRLVCLVQVEESLILCDPQEFLRPIITPFELEVALQAEGTWSGRYVLDFEKLLASDPENDLGTFLTVLWFDILHMAFRLRY
jgi:hypothetical protein